MCQGPHLLEMRGFKAVWFDKRKSVEALHLETVYGLIINLPSDFKLLGLLPTPFTSKHWIAIKAMDGHFFNLDSKLENPIKIGKVQPYFLKNSNFLVWTEVFADLLILRLYKKPFHHFHSKIHTSLLLFTVVRCDPIPQKPAKRALQRIISGRS